MPFIQRNNVKIHYEISGEGTPLLLLMGLGADLAAWEPHRREYEKHFQCISIDNRGAGLSELGIPEECSTETMADDAAAVLDALKIGPVQVAGISMGGAIAQMLAIRHPEKVKSLLLINTFAKASGFMKCIMGTLKACRPVVSALEFDRILQEFIYAASTFDLYPDILAEREAGIDPNAEGGMSNEAFNAQCDACINHNAEKDLSLIKVPAFIVAGEEDILTPVSGAKVLEAGIKDSILYINKGGHVQHFEYVEIFNRISLEFLLKHQ